MFHEDGSMRKPTKADLAHVLEEGISSTPTWPPCIPSDSVYIVDVMVLLHKTPAQYYSKSFGELVEALLAHIIRQFTHAHTVICVFDRYGDAADVKAYERRRRATSTSKSMRLLQAHHYRSGRHSLKLMKTRPHSVSSCQLTSRRMHHQPCRINSVSS